MVVLSTECWRAILEFLSIDEVTRLWFTGSHEVHQALGRRGGVTSFKLKVKKSFVLFAFPLELVSHFASLRELSIVLRHDHYLEDWLKISGDDIRRLPQGLETLILDFSEGLNDAIFPPRLTRLHLPKNSSLPSQSIASLPKSLSDLNLASNESVEPQLLPLELVKLKVPSFSLKSHRLSSSLRQLTLTNDEEWYDYDQELIGENASLETLKLRSRPKSRWWSPTSIVFHNSLTRLDMRSWDAYSDDFFQHLPRTMTALRLGWNFSSSDRFSDDFVLGLPPHLCSLILMPSNYKLLQKAPHNTTHYLESSLTISLFQRLSLQIEVLHLWHLLPTGMSPADCYSSLPPFIYDLNISIGNWSYPSVQWLRNKFSKLVIRTSPGALGIRYSILYDDVIPPIRKISCSSSSHHLDGLDGWLRAHGFEAPINWPPTLSSFRGELKIDDFPVKHLTHLEVLAFPPEDGDVSKFGDDLKVLRIEAAHNLSSACIPALPHELTELSLIYCQRMSIDQFRMPESLRKLELKRIPRLRFCMLPPLLTIFHCDIYELTNKEIAYLPKTITDLKLEGTISLTQACFRSLPSRLLYLELSTIELDDHHVHHLPRSLRSLAFRNGSHDITKEGVLQLPPLLRLLALTGEYFTDEMIEALPRSLIQLQLPMAEYLTTECLDLLPHSLTCLGLPASKPYSHCPLTEAMIREKLPLITLLDPGDHYW